MDKIARNPSKTVARSPAWAVTGQGAGGGGGGGDPTWEGRVAASHDDGEWDSMAYTFENEGATASVSSDEWMTLNESSFFRFTSVAVPQGATITEATLELIVSTAASTTFDMTLLGEAEDDAAQYTDETDASGAMETSAQLTWTGSSGWEAAEVVQSPDIKTIIQEITDRELWLSGNALTLRLHYDGGYIDESYVFKTYDSSPSVAAKLTIKYS